MLNREIDEYRSFLAVRVAADESVRQATTAHGGNARVLGELAVVRQAAVRVANQSGMTSSQHRPPQTVAFVESSCSNIVEGMSTAPTLIYWALEMGEMALVPPEAWPDVLDVARLTYAVRQQLRPRLAAEIANWEESENNLLCSHDQVFAHRPEILPGQYKTQENRVGGRLTVPCHQVQMTFREGWGMIRETEEPLARELMIEYLVVAVHPFRNGNGRVGRLLANGEAMRLGRQRAVMVPMWWRDYVIELREVRVAGSANNWVGQRMRTARDSVAWRWTSIWACLHHLWNTGTIEDWPHDRPDMIVEMRSALVVENAAQEQVAHLPPREWRRAQC